MIEGYPSALNEYTSSLFIYLLIPSFTYFFVIINSESVVLSNAKRYQILDSSNSYTSMTEGSGEDHNRNTAKENQEFEDDEDDEFTATLEQVGVLPRFSIWPHMPSIDYDPKKIAKRLVTAAAYYFPDKSNVEEIFQDKKDNIKSLCMNLSESFTEIVDSAIRYPVEDLNIDDEEAVEFIPVVQGKSPKQDTPVPSGVEMIKQVSMSKISLADDRLVNYDHLTYLTFEQFKDQKFLRDRIKKILKLDLSPLDQRFLIQKLMSRTYREKEKYTESPFQYNDDHCKKNGNGVVDMDGMIDNDDEHASNSDEVFLSDEALRPNYFNKDKMIFGCKHYRTNCKIECPVCKGWYPCPHCHDAVIKTHKLQRRLTRHFLCMYCNTPQDPQQYCANCNKPFGRYYCDKCKLCDDDPNKHIYHCDKCGICRLGLGLNKDYFHCDKCNVCISIELRDKHVCIENSTRSNCPICDEYMFNSYKTVVFMSCGHPIHQACYDMYTKHSYKCPLCSKSIVNMKAQFRILDKEIEQTVMPEELSNWKALIKCIDCGGRSKVPYHYLGLRCKHCGSYNTMQVKLLKNWDDKESWDSNPNFVKEQPHTVKNELDENFLFEKKRDDEVSRNDSITNGLDQIHADKPNEDAFGDSYVKNFVRVINRFEKYPSISEAFKDWMRTSMPDMQ